MLRLGHMCRHGGDDSRPNLAWQIMAHPLDNQKLGVGNGLSRVSAMDERYQDIIVPMDDESRQIQ